MNILLVDDSSTARLISRRTLKSLGFNSVLEAADGVEALALFQQHAIDVIFTDWNMPRMDGLQLVKAVRASNREVPIVMITTEGSKAKVLEAIQNGVNDYLVKPYTPVTLREKICKWVGLPAYLESDSGIAASTPHHASRRAISAAVTG